MPQWLRGEQLFRSSMVIPLPRAQVFGFFAAAENLERITPPELRFRIVSPLPVSIHEGALIEYRLRLFGVPFGWTTAISTWEPPHRFVDEQLRGPYTQWIHTHTFTESGGGTRIDDEVRYRLPLGYLGRLGTPLVAIQVGRIFAHRERAIRALLLDGSAPTPAPLSP